MGTPPRLFLGGVEALSSVSFYSPYFSSILMFRVHFSLYYLKGYFGSHCPCSVLSSELALLIIYVPHEESKKLFGSVDAIFISVDQESILQLCDCLADMEYH